MCLPSFFLSRSVTLVGNLHFGCIELVKIELKHSEVRYIVTETAREGSLKTIRLANCISDLKFEVKQRGRQKCQKVTSKTN